MNVHQHNEPVATHNIYSNTIAIGDGSTCTQLFFSTNSLVLYVYGMKIDNQFANTLEYNICAWGEMIKFISDCTQSEVSNFAQSILWSLLLMICNIEPHYYQQKVSERCYHKINLLTNTIPDCTGSRT